MQENGSDNFHRVRQQRRKSDCEMKYTTVIFDLDGTLLNTLEDLKDAVNHALTRNGYPERTLEEVREFVGNGVRKLMERALPESVERAEFDSVFWDFKNYYNCHYADKTCAYDGVMELLAKLRADGVKTAIVSNKMDSAVQELYEKYFRETIQAAVGEREGVNRKPAPDMVQIALKKLGGSAKETVYVGDSDVDIKTAENAGLFCISVSWGFRDAEFLRRHGARLIADTPQQVYEFISDPPAVQTDDLPGQIIMPG